MPRKTNLESEDRRQLLLMLDNSALMASFRKLLLEEAAFWQTHLQNESLQQSPNTNLMIQYAAKASAVASMEAIIRSAAGL
jgi:hypothetical protein